jgi:predicted nucleotidyltransferase
MAVKRQASLPKDRLQAFETLHGEQLLGAHETVSGTGSTLMATEHLRRGLEHLFHNGFCNSVLDVGCGDFNWMSAVDMRGMLYTGIDIIEELVEGNRRNWQEPRVKFEVMDIMQTVPPTHDLVLCRDLFSHFPPHDIVTAFNHIKKSGARYFAATSYIPGLTKPKLREPWSKQLNSLNGAGYWRPVNLCSAPFRFTAPLLSIPESPGKALDIWRLSDLPALDHDEIQFPSRHNPIEAGDFMELEFFQKLIALPFIERIALYGSRARKDHRPDSDIDLMVWCDPDTTQEQWLHICDIVQRAGLSISVDCLRYDESVSTIPSGYFRDHSIYRFIYDRASS